MITITCYNKDAQLRNVLTKDIYEYGEWFHRLKLNNPGVAIVKVDSHKYMAQLKDRYYFIEENKHD